MGRLFASEIYGDYFLGGRGWGLIGILWYIIIWNFYGKWVLDMVINWYRYSWCEISC